MAVEIERKFLLASDEWRQAVYQSVPMRQGYLSRNETYSIRVRTANGQAWLNIKKAEVGAQRDEYEYPIPLADAEQMLNSCDRQSLIEKKRHYVRYGSHTWEIDEFDGANQGLVVAEVELQHADESFERAGWLGEEVTDDLRYYNTSLARKPYQNW